MTYQRSKVVQYSKIYLYSSITDMTPAKSLGFSVILILEPFTAWITLWISILFVLIFMIIYQKFIVYKIIKNRFDITWPLISALVRQGNFISFKLLLDF